MRLILASEFSEVFDKAKPYFPKCGKLVTVINTAAIGEGYELSFDKEIKPFKDIGYEVDVFDLMTMEGLKNQLDKSDIIYVAGGNTFYLLEAVQKSGFANTLKERADQNFLYIGSSAGSILMSPDIDFIAPMDDNSKADLDTTQGLNYIPFSFLPHVGHLTMGGAAEDIKIRSQEADKKILCLTDNQAIYVDGNMIEVL